MAEMEMGKNDRVLDIYTRLLNGQLIKKAEMAQIFRVNTRTIQRDIDNIRKFLDHHVSTDGIRKYVIYDYKQKGYRMEQGVLAKEI